MTRSTWTPRVAVAIGAFAIAPLLSGPTLGRADADTYTGCLNSGGSITRVAIGTSPKGSCSPNETQISWNTAGPPGPAGPLGPAGPAGPAGPPGPAGVLGFYKVTTVFNCPGPAICSLVPPPIASCDPGDIATGGGAYRVPLNPATPLQDFAAIPYPQDLTSNPPTGFTTVNQNVDVGDTIYVVAICADLP